MPNLFREQAVHDAVKMIEIKISQGAKPGHGGVLPAAKITAEIARTRKVPMGQDCISPPGHSAFDSPRGLCEFIAQLRELSGGKPVGFKLCIGHPTEFLAVCKAMLATGILPDFITVDGGEGGTGAAPMEFSDSLGTPLRDGLMFVHNALVGCNLRDKIRIAASGKVSSAFSIARNLAIGADWCNAARGFMMAVGCIQAQTCHTNHCPVGVATQDPVRQRALDVGDKSERAYHFHRTDDGNTVGNRRRRRTGPRRSTATVAHLSASQSDTNPALRRGLPFPAAGRAARHGCEHPQIRPLLGSGLGRTRLHPSDRSRLRAAYSLTCMAQ